MRVNVLSDTRVPTVPEGGHGLGRSAIDIARVLTRMGHTVTLYAGPGSRWEGALVEHANETQRAHELDKDSADAWLDISHYHDLSQVHPGWPVVNYILDLECRYQPPNTVVNTTHANRRYLNARFAPLGIPVDDIPLRTGKRSYLTFCAKIHALKGHDIAMDVAERVKPLITYFVGENVSGKPVPNYRGVLTTPEQLYGWLGGAMALLSPYRADSGGRVNLEAAACGTPVLCLAGVATEEHVGHCISGFVCGDADEMVDAVQDVVLLNPQAMRDWVRETHDILVMGKALEAHCNAVASGEAW